MTSSTRRELPGAQLHESLKAVGPPPCEWPRRCSHYTYCQTQETACNDYAKYLSKETGSRARKNGGRDPSRRLFVQLFAAPADESAAA